MSSIQRDAVVARSARELFDLVNDVEAYPRRFDWCDQAQVLESSDVHMVARLHVRAAGLRTAFTTRNTLVAAERIELNLVDGPFRRFSGGWHFEPLAEDTCRVSLRLDFEAANRLLGSALAFGFKGLADRMVGDFCRVAERGG